LKAVEPLRVAVAGGDEAPALVEALAASLANSTGLRCGTVVGHPSALDVVITPIGAGAIPAATLTLLIPSPAATALRAELLRAGASWSVLPAEPALQLEAAIDALTPLLLKRAPPRNGLFSRLQAREAAQPAWRWVCEKCDVPECEHASFAKAQ
jgi:hypothetical protein